MDNNYHDKQFLMCDDGEEDKILIFATNEFLKILTEGKTVFSNGTFRSVPKIFCQLYTLHGIYLGQMFSLIYVLLPDKRQETCAWMFLLLQDYGSHNNSPFLPKHFQIDFEVAVIDVIKIVFPNTKISGCMFHYSQCDWRKVQDLGLSNAYNNVLNVRDLIKSVAALLFLPIKEIDTAWDLIVSKTEIVSPDSPIANKLSMQREHG
jgi:hypothetical protein